MIPVILCGCYVRNYFRKSAYFELVLFFRIL